MSLNGKHPRYVPALRWKRGEISALKRSLKAPEGTIITPLLLLDNVAEREQNETKKIPSDPMKYIDFTASEMQKFFNSQTAFVDTKLFDSQRPGIDALVEFFRNPIAKLSPLVPVLRLTDAEDRLREFRDTDPVKGIALRLEERHFRDRDRIDAFLAAVGVDERAVDLIADLDKLEEERADIDPLAELIDGLSQRSKPWRSVTLLAGGYPSKPAFHDDRWIDCPRFEWLTYTKVATSLRRQKKLVPAYGDYGIINPKATPTSGSGGGGGTRPIIRYCLHGSWRIRRAPEVMRKGAVSKYFDLARECVTSSIFMGRDFSDGDRYIDDRAMGLAETAGNASSYITVDTNHHIAFVVAQLRRGLLKASPRSDNELPLSELLVGSTPFDEYWDA